MSYPQHEARAAADVRSLDDHIRALTAFRTLPPIERARRAAQLIEEAKAVLSLERALAIAEARESAPGTAVARELGVTPQAIGKADRLLMRRALELFLTEDVAAVDPAQIAAGLRDNVTIEAMARRVLHGARNVRPGALGDDQQAMVDRAERRANAILGMARCTHLECNEPGVLVAGGLPYCSPEHVPAELQGTLGQGEGTEAALRRLNPDLPV